MSTLHGCQGSDPRPDVQEDTVTSIVADDITLTADLAVRRLVATAGGVDRYVAETLPAGEAVRVVLTSDGSDWGIGFRRMSYVATQADVMAATARPEAEIEANVEEARRQGLI